MIRFKKTILFLLLVILSADALTQFNPNEVCRFQEGKIIFRLDSRWTEQQKKEISRLFSLNDTVLMKAFTRTPSFRFNGIDWRVDIISPSLIDLSRRIDEKSITQGNEMDVLLLQDELLPQQLQTNIKPVDFGTNKFTRRGVFVYNNGKACLYLPGYKNARHVYLSGSFNSWSTTQTPMHPSDSGWNVCLRLPPGKYNYKFIVDGRWIIDPNNKNKEDLNNGKNSFFFCYNYVFRLKGYLDKQRVILAGSFNHWNENELSMARTATGWHLPVYLKQGTYFYKFIADGKWMIDPANGKSRLDSDGNLNSFIEFGDTMTFRLNGYRTAVKVVLSGSFNSWSTNELVMQKTSFGWELPYVLAPGNYGYKFIVDGRWITDPGNPLSTGSGDHKNSFLTFKPNYEFRLNRYPAARQVFVTGNFNNWDEEGYCMQKKNGQWTLPVFLNPGKYIYKFIVDGQWIIDPDNKLWEENEFGTGNSVLWIAPHK